MRYLLIVPALALAAGLLPRAVTGADPDAEPQVVDSDAAVRQDGSTVSGDCEQGGVVPISGSAVSVQRLIGMPVTNPINEEIGEVSDLILDQCGRIKVMIVHVGGFMGIGGRDVRIALDKLWIRSPEQSAGMVIMVRQTRKHILSSQNAVSQEDDE